jgi:hypothetical protein
MLLCRVFRVCHRRLNTYFLPKSPTNIIINKTINPVREDPRQRLSLIEIKDHEWVNITDDQHDLQAPPNEEWRG